MTLFDHSRKERQSREAPLAARMRPRTFDEFLGQEQVVGQNRALRRAIEADRLPSVILWGPPGSGKTTLALLIASATRSHFEPMSAVTAGVADLRRVVAEAKDRRAMHGQRTILFIDEIHRFNKAQQDAILPHVEDGTVTLIGATTENPSFEVNAPLLSRCRVFTLRQLTDDEVRALIERALADPERGLGKLHARLDKDALEFLVTSANGDARTALNGLELAVESAPPDSDGSRLISLALLEDALQHHALQYDQAGDQHYDTISAFIKSVRSSDPDAAVYWLARMLEAGEDPLFIARRIIILAAEDIGMADPHALPVAVAAQQAVHFIGLPEGAIPLAEATVYLATAPKSNTAYMALQRAREDVKTTRNDPVPLPLRNAVTGLMKAQGYGKGYKYAHEFEGHFVRMQNRPDRVNDRVYYEPSNQGYELEVAERIRKWWGERRSPDVSPQP
jgi:putative ATPase